MAAKLTSISISGVRTLNNFTLDLNGLTVLIGENGTGKSTLVEAIELLRRVANQNFWSEFNQIHGGMAMLLCHRVNQIELGAKVCGGNWKGGYDIAFGKSGINSERLWIATNENPNTQTNIIERIGEVAHFRAMAPRAWSSRLTLPAIQPAIGTRVMEHPEPKFINEFVDVFEKIDVQVPFDSTAYWLSRSQGQRPAPMRDSVTITPSNKLERGGGSLANAYYNLKERSKDEWEYTMELVRLGLGHWVEAVNLPADAGGGKIGLSIKIADVDKQILAAGLSDGQLAYLAFVALAQLPTERSILVFDEIESHLHPRMLTRVLDLMRSISERCPVLLTTHSRRVLDNLDEPAKSVGILELDEEPWWTKLRRLDEAKLKEWLADYDGFGSILDAGYPEVLFETDEGR